MKSFFLKVSKTRLNQFSQVQKRTRPRAMQVYLALLSWLNTRKTLSLGVQYFYGRSKGKLCYHKDFRKFVKRYTGLEHKQLLRYLREFEKKGLIYINDKQISLDGKIRRQYFLNPGADLRAKKGEKYLKLNMRKCGQKDFDIYDHLELSTRFDSNPKHPDQLKFSIPRSTRWDRKQPKSYKKKAKKQAKPLKTPLIPRIRKMTLIANIKPLPFYRKEDKTTFGQKKSTKSYQNQLCLIHNGRRIWVDWWKTKQVDSEFSKKQAGLDFSDKALWYCGRIYKKTDQQYCYELFVKKKGCEHYHPEVPGVEQTRQLIASLKVPQSNQARLSKEQTSRLIAGLTTRRQS